MCNNACIAIFVINSDKPEIEVNLFDPNGHTPYKKQGQGFVKIAFTATETGNHQVCIKNYGNERIKINFEFLSGVAAKDYSAIAKKSTLKPIELNVSLSLNSCKATKTWGYDVLFNSWIKLCNDTWRS